MNSTQSSELSNPRQVKSLTQFLAVLIGILPLYSSLIIYQIRKDQPPSNQGFIFYLAVICPLTILIALLLLRFLCKESYRELNLKPGTLFSDLLATLILSIVILVSSVTLQYFLSQLLPASTSNLNIRDLFIEMNSKPELLIIFTGPLVFMGAASEELIRVFLLSRLWKVWSSTIAKFAVVVISAFLFGLIHIYRGPIHVVWTCVFGLIMAFYYLRFGRVLPLILAHYVTNALQVIVVALA
jgi:membrane protease YdiL (CAAX protease family)